MQATFHEMEKRIMKALDALRASMVKLNDSMDNIKADVERLEAGSVSPEEIAEIQTHADNLATKAQELQDLVPDAPAPPEEPTPAPAS
jgi:hypothetical protein